MPDPLYLGIEIGGTKLQLGLGSGDGRLVGFERIAIRADRGAAGILDQIEGAVGPLLERSGIERIAGVGVGFGGPVDSGRGVVTASHQVEGWAGFPLAEHLRLALGVERIAVENDADTAALAEARLGAGVGFSPLLYVTVGSGIGGGLIVDGRIYRGGGGAAMEVGHVLVEESNRVDDEPRTVESVASGWAIGRAGRSCADREIRDGWPAGRMLQLAGGDPSRIAATTVAEAAKQGDPDAGRIMACAAVALGSALAHATTLLSPRRIILGGGVSLLGEERWLGPVRRELHRRVFPPLRGTFDLVPAALGEEVVVYGALVLAHEAHRQDAS